MTRNIGILAMLVVSVQCLAACIAPLTYSAEPINAQIVDAETKRPIEGVVIVANWQLKEGTLGGSVPAGQLMVMETVTDKEGKFTFPAWGPKTTWKGHLVNEDPQLLIFKSGYRYRRLLNAYSSSREARLKEIRRSDWNGKQIELELLQAMSVQSQYENLLDFSKEVDNFATWHLDPCQWTKLPMTIRTIKASRKELETRGGRLHGIRTLDTRLLDGEREFIKACGSAGADFLREIKHD